MNVKYSDVKIGLRTGVIRKPEGPCEIRQCDSCGCGKTNCDISHGVFVYDHCHIHGYVRGVICASCNRKMFRFDKYMAARNFTRIARSQWWAPVSSYFRHWEKCPECKLEFETGEVVKLLDNVGKRYLELREKGRPWRYRVRIYRQTRAKVRKVRNAHAAGNGVGYSDRFLL
jgi:hypothetical protein